MQKFLIALGLALAAGSVGAQSVLEFDIWMQKIDVRSQSILRHLARQDATAGADDARELERLYQLMETWYEKKGGSDDAVLASNIGKGWAADVQRALSRQDFDSATKAAVDLARDCRNCHIRYKPIL